MTTINANGIDIAYEVHGRDDDPAMLLIQGLGMPLSGWPTEFVDRVVSHGFRAILFDNRDIGRSQLFEAERPPSVILQLLKKRIGLPTRAPYRLHDMARDAECLLDELGIESAHVVGVSMGGMIAQLLAIHCPGRVASLTSIMSTTGDTRLPGADKAVQRHMLKGPAEPTREARLQYQLVLWRLIGSPEYPTPEERRREWLQRHFERGLTADGIARQMLAIVATPDRTDELKKLRVPTLVIHGEDDTLVPVECGHATASAIAKGSS